MSWFAANGLGYYYGTYCQSGRIVQDIASEAKPGWLLAYYTCDECASVKSQYLSHPIGLIFAAADRPQRVMYLNASGIQAYRCQ